MRTELARLQEAVVELSRFSVDTMLKKVLDYASRPLPEFRKYEALEMVEALQNTARDNKHEKQDYYRLAYHTARSKIELPNDYFQSLILQLLGDKDHQKVFDAVTKVEKSWSKVRSSPYPSSYGPRGPYGFQQTRSLVSQIKCFYCRKWGHMATNCMLRRSKQPATQLSAAAATKRDDTQQ